MLHRGDANGLAVPRLALDGKRNAAAFGRALGLIAITFHCQGKHRLVTPSSQRSPTGHLNCGIDGVFEIARVVGRGLVSIAEVHAIVAGAKLAQGKPEMARNRFSFLERHEYFRGTPEGIRSVLRTAARCECVPLTFDAGVVSLQLVKRLAMSRTINHMNPPAAVPHITGADA